MVAPKKVEITVVVNGQPTVVDAVEDAPLGMIIPDALRQTETQASRQRIGSSATPMGHFLT